MLICILTKNVITSCSVTMMLFLHLEVKPLMTLTTVLYLSCALISGHLAMMLMELTKRDRKSGSAGMPRPISYAVFCLKKKPCFCRKIQWSELLAKELGIRRSGDHRSVISRKWTRREIYGKTFHCGFALESLTQFIVCGDASSHK